MAISQGVSPKPVKKSKQISYTIEKLKNKSNSIPVIQFFTSIQFFMKKISMLFIAAALFSAGSAFVSAKSTPPGDPYYLDSSNNYQIAPGGAAGENVDWRCVSGAEYCTYQYDGTNYIPSGSQTKHFELIEERK